MALVDEEKLKVVGSDKYVPLLSGEGIVTNMSEINKDLLIRYGIATITPPVDAVGRLVSGRPNGSPKDSFVNTDSETTIYGKATRGTIEVLVTNSTDY